MDDDFDDNGPSAPRLDKSKKRRQNGKHPPSNILFTRIPLGAN